MTPPIASPSLPMDSRVEVGTLDNGLTYYLQRHEPQKQRAHLLFVVKAGSLNEEDDQRGLAHFVEHMAFNGTRRFTQPALLDFFEKSGLKFGSHANAQTSYNQTQYQLSVPTDRPELLDTALDVLEDWAGGLVFAPDEVEKERPVLLSEWTSSKGASKRVRDLYLKLLLAGSRYVERDVIGDPKVLETAPRQRIVDFYRRWYRPDRMAVIVVGDIDERAVKGALKQRFSNLPAAEPATASPEPDRSIPVLDKPSAAVIADPEATALLASVALKVASRPPVTEAEYRTQLLRSMASRMLSRRLDALREEPDAPFTSASSRLTPSVFGQLLLFDASAHAKEGKLVNSFEVLLTELERVKRHGFLEVEFKRTALQFERYFEQRVAAQATVNGQALASELATHFATGGRVLGPEYERDLGTRLLAEVTAQDVSRAASELLAGGQQLLLASGPTRDALPEQSALMSALAATHGAAVEPHREEAITLPLMAELPTPGKVSAERVLSEIGVTEWTLSNGARVVVKPTDFEDDQILMRAISLGGTGYANDAEFPSARHAASIVASSGLGPFDRQTLRKVLAGRVAGAGPWIDENTEGISGDAAPKDVETLLKLVHLFVTAPRRDEPAFEAFVASLKEGLRNRDLNPAELLSDAVVEKVWNNSPRRRTPTVESVEAIDLSTVLEFYKDRFADVSDFTFVFVGKLDVGAMKPLVERYIASLPGGGRKEKPQEADLHWRKGITRVLVKAGKEDKASVSLVYHGEAPWSENAHTDLVSLQSYLGIRLREVLREQLGAVYSPQVSSTFQRIPFPQHRLSIGFQCKPTDIDKLLKATRTVMADVKKSGIAPSYVEKLKSLRTRELEEGYRSNRFWLDRLSTQYNLDLDPTDILLLYDLTQRITSDNLRLAARKYLRDDQYLDARLLPGE